ncbi:MAG: hypothetical protein DRP74_02695 [Candidatus Omnitrophota bacterium]|nr:MAG: hypothetical protein DRP74_02695 [Candidatus Omnitrophota bacterium]
MNVVDTPDIITQKGQATYILNCYNHPEGGIAKLFGRSKHNSSAIGSDDEITGIYELDITTPAFFCIAESKFYKDNNGTWEDKTGGVSITDSANNLWTFSKFQDYLIGTCLLRDSAIEHDGGSGNATNVSNMPAGKFNAVLKNRLFSLNTAAQPKLAYWSGINDRTFWDITNDYLNFKASESDDKPISGVCEHLNTLVVGKEDSIFRVYHTGTTPPFKYYCISRKTGVMSHFSMQNIPPCGAYPERLIWIGRDNFYQLIGDTVTSIGDDIKAFFSEGAPFQINLNRLQYCVSGIIKEKNLYWCAFTSGSGSTNDYCFILDYKNMQWCISDFVVNSFGKRKVSGREYLYSGNYTGTVCKHDTSVYNNLGAAYTSQMYFPWLDFGDTQLEKQIKYLIALFDAVGNYDITVEYRTNLETDNFTLSMVTGVDLLGIDFVLGTSTLGGVDVVERSGEINKRMKRIQLLISHSTVDEYFRLYALGFLWRPMKGYRIE